MPRFQTVMLLATAVVAQGRVDPYTVGAPDAMRAVGIVGHGPFLLGERHTTTDVEQELGNPQLRWLETAHFKIGGDLQSRPWPEDPVDRATFLSDYRELRRALPALPDRLRQLDGWLQLLLQARRLERSYRHLLSLTGVDDAWFGDHAARGCGGGPNLGCSDKFVVLLFQRESDLARYLRTWCQTRADRPWTWRYRETMNWGFATSTESCRGELAEPASLAAHVVFFTSRNMVHAWLGAGKAPFWWQDGLAQWLARRVTPGVMHLTDVQDPDHTRFGATDWPRKVRIRLVQHTLPPLADMLCWRDNRDRTVADHAALWSFLDWFVRQDPGGLARLFQQARATPIPELHDDRERVLAWHRDLLQQIDLDLAGAEAAWHRHVLTTYPRR